TRSLRPQLRHSSKIVTGTPHALRARTARGAGTGRANAAVAIAADCRHEHDAPPVGHRPEHHQEHAVDGPGPAASARRASGAGCTPGGRRAPGRDRPERPAEPRAGDRRNAGRRAVTGCSKLWTTVTVVLADHGRSATVRARTGGIFGGSVWASGSRFRSSGAVVDATTSPGLTA